MHAMSDNRHEVICVDNAYRATGNNVRRRLSHPSVGFLPYVEANDMCNLAGPRRTVIRPGVDDKTRFHRPANMPGMAETKGSLAPPSKAGDLIGPEVLDAGV